MEYCYSAEGINTLPKGKGWATYLKDAGRIVCAYYAPWDTGIDTHTKTTKKIHTEYLIHIKCSDFRHIFVGSYL